MDREIDFQVNVKSEGVVGVIVFTPEEFHRLGTLSDIRTIIESELDDIIPDFIFVRKGAIVSEQQEKVKPPNWAVYSVRKDTLEVQVRRAPQQVAQASGHRRERNDVQARREGTSVRVVMPSHRVSDPGNAPSRGGSRMEVEEAGHLLLQTKGGIFVKYYFQLESKVFLRYYRNKGAAPSSGGTRSNNSIAEVDMRTVTELRPRNSKSSSMKTLPSGHFLLEIVQGPKVGWLLGVPGFNELTRWVKAFHRSSSLPSLTYEIDVKTFTWFPVERQQDTAALPMVEKTIQFTFDEGPLGLALCAGRGGSLVHHCNEGGQAEARGVKAGDLVMQVGSFPTTGLSWRDVVKLLAESPRPVTLTMGRSRGGKGAKPMGYRYKSQLEENAIPENRTVTSTQTHVMRRIQSYAPPSYDGHVTSAHASGKHWGTNGFAKPRHRVESSLDDDYTAGRVESMRDPGNAAKRQLSRYRSVHRELSATVDEDERTFSARKTRLITSGLPGQDFGFQSMAPNRKIAASSRLRTMDHKRGKRVKNIVQRATDRFAQWMNYKEQAKAAALPDAATPTKPPLGSDVVDQNTTAHFYAAWNDRPEVGEEAGNATNHGNNKGKIGAGFHQLLSGAKNKAARTGQLFGHMVGRSNRNNKEDMDGMEGPIAPLVKMLLYGSATERQDAAEAVLDLACNSVNQRTLASAGAIPALVALLKTGSKLAKENAAGALWNLSDNDENEVAIAQAGAIPPLVALLKDGTDIAKEEAAGALWNLADNDENKALLVGAGGIKPLVRLLETGTDFTNENAAGALWNIATQPSNWEAIVAEGAIPMFVKLLTRGTVVAGENAAGALMHLCYDVANREKTVNANAVEPLVQMLAFGSDISRENCAGALAEIANNNSAYQLAISREGAIPALVSLLSSDESSEKGQARAAAALRALAQEGELKKQIANAGAIPPLGEAVGNVTSSMYLQANAIDAVWGLAYGSDVNQVLIAKEGIIPKLVDAVKRERKTTKLQIRAAGALGTLAENSDNRSEIVQCGAVSPLCNLLLSPNKYARRNAAAALRLLSTNDRGASAITSALRDGAAIGVKRADINTIRAKLDAMGLSSNR